jgi:hypothetical protein
MQGIYTYIPETNHFPKEYNIAAILSLLFMVPVLLLLLLLLLFNCNWVDTCGSSIHLHTHSTQNTEDGTHITITMKKQLQGTKLGINLGSPGRAPSL